MHLKDTQRESELQKTDQSNIRKEWNIVTNRTSGARRVSSSSRNSPAGVLRPHQGAILMPSPSLQGLLFPALWLLLLPLACFPHSLLSVFLFFLQSFCFVTIQFLFPAGSWPLVASAMAQPHSALIVLLTVKVSLFPCSTVTKRKPGLPSSSSAHRRPMGAYGWAALDSGGHCWSNHL